MHYFTNIDDLKQEIEGYGHMVENIWNIKYHKTKNPLTMFFVDLKQAPNNKEIYDITSLLQHRVKFEPPRQKREIPYD
jgi:RNAse (barnase) inhibitor barstar